MVDKNFFDDLAQQIAKLLPAASALGNDVKKNISAVMQSSFQKMDLVTREEFDAQVLALARAEQRIAAMELLIQDLEKKASSGSAAAADPGDLPGD